jgi:ubiquinone/menaquinone biosynthesis C-methylase UbiE
MAHDHSHHHAGLAHTHDHHHGPSGDWTSETVRWYVDRYGKWPSPGLLAEHVVLSEGQVLVDVGCGTGSLLRLLRQRHPGGRCVGVDVSAEMLSVARAQTDDAGIEYQTADANALPIGGESADVVVFLNTLHHLPEPEAALVEALRILKPGGTIWVGTDEDVYDMAGWSNGRVRDELSAAGFRRIQQTSGHAGDVVLNVLVGTRRA